MSSSGSDSDEIVTDGFPPEVANNAKFISLKSTSDTTANQRVFLPITSWNFDFLPLDIVKICIRVLKESAMLCELEKKQILQQLEIQLNHNIDVNQNNELIPKSSAINSKPNHSKLDINKPSTIKVNVEIPTANANSSNIKYGVVKPTFDPEKLCWKTSMHFIIPNENDTVPILESQKEVSHEDKETQTELKTGLRKNSFDAFAQDMRSRSETSLVTTETNYPEIMERQVNSDADILVIEKMEISFGSTNEKFSGSQFMTAFRNYTSMLKNTIEIYYREVRKLKSECQSLLNLSYDSWTESNFKCHAKDQLFVSDVEKKIIVLEKEVNNKTEKVNKLSKSTTSKDRMKLESEARSIQFIYSVKIILQMLTNLKTQIHTFKKELMGKNKKPFFT